MASNQAREPSGFQVTFAAWPTQERVGHALRSWKKLNEVVMLLTEEEVRRALLAEQANKRRGNLIRRLRQRLAKMRRDCLMKEKI